MFPPEMFLHIFHTRIQFRMSPGKLLHKRKFHAHTEFNKLEGTLIITLIVNIITITIFNNVIIIVIINLIHLFLYLLLPKTLSSSFPSSPSFSSQFSSYPHRCHRSFHPNHLVLHFQMCKDSRSTNELLRY